MLYRFPSFLPLLLPFPPTCRYSDQIYLFIVYTLVFFYIYLTIGQFEFVKSKLGLGIAGVCGLPLSRPPSSLRAAVTGAVAGMFPLDVDASFPLSFSVSPRSFCGRGDLHFSHQK